MPSKGALLRGVALPNQGPGYVRARPRDPTRYGTPTLVRVLQNAARSVAEKYPGGAPLRIGNLSSPRGGRHAKHRSHRSGRDADLIYYATDALGRSVTGRGWLAFDRFGIAREGVLPKGIETTGEVYLLDEARNWHLVRTLVLDERANVQWIFCSLGIKARLLRYAARHERNPEALVRASWVLHQPSRGRWHDDHFHVRVACTVEERASGCRDDGPIWHWQRARFEKPPFDWVSDQDDAALVRALLSDED
jgi:penicillin-insensitive murein endopeptidase